MKKQPDTVKTEPKDATLLQTMVAGNLTPTQLLLITAIAIFVGEALIMFIMPLFGALSVGLEAFLDSLMLTCITAPLLYLFLFRPMVLHIDQRTKAEKALRELAEDLEDRIEERTNDLTRSNRALSKEVKERSATEERLRRTNSFVQRLIESAPCMMATIDVNTLKCNYVNGRVEDFLGYSPDDMIASEGALFDSVIAEASSATYRDLINEVAMGPDGAIARGLFELENREGDVKTYRAGIVVVSRTAIGEAQEALLVIHPTEDCD